MAERLAYLPLVVLIIVCGGILLVFAGQELAKWLIARSERRAAARVVAGSRDRSLPGKARVRARRGAR